MFNFNLLIRQRWVKLYRTRYSFNLFLICGELGKCIYKLPTESYRVTIFSLSSKSIFIKSFKTINILYNKTFWCLKIHSTRYFVLILSIQRLACKRHCISMSTPRFSWFHPYNVWHKLHINLFSLSFFPVLVYIWNSRGDGSGLGTGGFCPLKMLITISIHTDCVFIIGCCFFKKTWKVLKWTSYIISMAFYR